MAMQVLSYQIADAIEIKAFRSAFKAELRHGDSEELFYCTGATQYIYVFRYGVVCFLNYDAIHVSAFLKLIAPYCRNLFPESLNEEFTIITDAPATRISFNQIEIVDHDEDTLRLIMLNVAQSVALDYYSDQTSLLLDETNAYTQMLERKGRLDISGTNLKKYIGKTLNLKNRISHNLYIFDSPDETWTNENLNRIDQDMKRLFDIQERFRNISEGLSIVRDNLDLFRDILQYRNSTVLEWIVIILIAVEVANMAMEKLF